MIYIIYLIVSTLIFIFQTTLCQYIAIAGIIPNVMLIFVVVISLLKGPNEGLIIGVIMGLLQDSYFCEYIGSNLFLYGIIGYLIGYLTPHINRSSIVTSIYMTMFATIIYNVCFYTLNIVLRGYTGFNIYFFLNILTELVYNVILVFLVYPTIYYINQKGTQYLEKNNRF